MEESLSRFRFPLVALAGLALLAALWAGLLRLGWRLPPLQSALAITHGPLMVGGVLGTAAQTIRRPKQVRRTPLDREKGGD
ncbi:MAG: hypothetical protein ACOYZ7_05810 [Chloroflexota bacterium]